jgi:hypothetical protein
VTTGCTMPPRPRDGAGGAAHDREARMPLEYHCAQCNETFREDTVEGVLKRAAAHNHLHHGGPESLTPELEAALRADIKQV